MGVGTRPRSKCRKCGTRFEGKGELCLSCLANAPTMLETRKKEAPTTSVRASTRPAPGGPVCPYCGLELTWDNMQTSETEVTIYVREKMYYCPSCRALLGFSSWHTEG